MLYLLMCDENLTLFQVMSKQQIVLPQEREILTRIREHFFSQHKLYRMTYYKSLMHCAPLLKQIDQYQRCTAKVDDADVKAQRVLESELDKFQEKYRKNLKKCKQNASCYEKQLKTFEQSVENIYANFYTKVTKETSYP